ncbi:MAG: segregation/condensation protein A [Methanoregulaceae archaeon]|jgi:segregation and condensation protein A|nr:segregation/condensation protein A [Methanoregulaceae archaeon]
MSEEPVEILVQMAERGEIDPWNIDIVEVTDRFLSELERRKELDLRISGRTLFYAAILLRMKSEYLDLSGNGEEEEVPDDDEGFDLEDDFPEGAGGPIEQLEREIRRRLDRKNLRKRPVTLFELILELKNAEKEQRRRQRFRSPFSMDAIDVEGVVGIAHEEGYQEAAMAVLGQCEETISAEGVVTLHELAALLGKRIFEVYIPLLFLMSEGKLTLWQEEFFGEVMVSACPVGK